MERIKLLRDESKITQQALATELSVSQETISGYENGKVCPPIHVLIQLADCFHTSVDYLLERSDNRNAAGLWESHLSETESELIYFFRKLDLLKRERVLGYILGLID